MMGVISYNSSTLINFDNSNNFLQLYMEISVLSRIVFLDYKTKTISQQKKINK